MTRDKQADDQGQWLSLGPAARLLGVSEVTLRHWADAGRVRSYRTIGSHRRFARADLTALLQQQQAPVPAARFGTIEDKALQQVRRRLHNPRTPQPNTPALDEEARIRLRVLGRRLLELALRYHQEPRRRGALQEEARFVGNEYGVETHNLGLTLSQALESFLFHRTVLIDTVRGLVPADHGREEMLDLWRDVAHLMDTVMLALVQSYERVQ